MEKLEIAFEPFLGDDVRQHVIEGLHAFNHAASGQDEHYPANFILRGEAGDVLGGLLGYVWGRWLHVTYLWLAEPARGGGYGSRLIGQAEVARLVFSRKMDVRPLISHTFSLPETAQAVALAAHPTADSLKVVVTVAEPPGE